MKAIVTPNQFSESEENPLIMALMENNESEAMMLLEYKQSRTTEGVTELMILCKNECLSHLAPLFLD